MANNRSAEKRIRQTTVRRLHNRSLRSRMRTAVGAVRHAIQDGDQKRVQELLQPTLSLIDRTAQKRVIHANAAARTKSRLVRAAREVSS